MILQKKSIMHVAECAGGVDRYLSLLLPPLNDEFENIFVCSQQYDIEKWERLIDKVELLEMNNRMSLKADLKAILKLRKLIKKYNPDIIYFHSSKAGGIGRLANIGLCKKVIYNPHGWAFKMKNNNKSLAFLVIEKLLSLITTKIVTISDFEKKIALDKTICVENKLVVIKNGVDISNYLGEGAITRNELKIPEDAFVIGYVARISYGKSPDFFIMVASKLLKEIPNSYFIFIGDGELKEETILLAKKYGVYKHLIITGWVCDVRQYIRLLDVGVLFTRWEGFGYALAEYMVESIPVIGTNIDSIPELIEDGKNGYLIEVENQEEAVERLKILFYNPQIRKELGTYGNEFVKRNFDAKRVIEEHYRLFDALLST